MGGLLYYFESVERAENEIKYKMDLYAQKECGEIWYIVHIMGSLK